MWNTLKVLTSVTKVLRCILDWMVYFSAHGCILQASKVYVKWLELTVLIMLLIKFFLNRVLSAVGNHNALIHAYNWSGSSPCLFNSQLTMLFLWGRRPASISLGRNWALSLVPYSNVMDSFFTSGGSFWWKAQCFFTTHTFKHIHTRQSKSTLFYIFGIFITISSFEAG